MSLVYRYSVVWFTYPHIKDSRYLSFLIVGKEICPKTKKVHFQGYAEMKIRLSFKRLKIIFGPTAHIERARKCAMANIRYCIKDGNIKYNIGNAADPIASAFLALLNRKSRKLKSTLSKLRTKQDAKNLSQEIYEAQASIQGKAISKVKKEDLREAKKICGIHQKPKELSEETRG